MRVKLRDIIDADDWYKYRYEAFREIAIAWCEYNNIEYIDDTEKPLSADEG